jgi:PHD/YefM family antitoxin component YafN of YafNO toxin-antitoxin module
MADDSTAKHISVNPTVLVKQMNNIMPVDVYGNGDEVPVVVYNERGRRYLVEVYMWDVTEDPFYRAKGLFERLAERRKQNAANKKK